MIYDISYKTLIGPKSLQIRFDKIDGFIRIYDETRYFTLFGFEKYDAIFNRIRYFISLKSSITYVFSHYYAKSKLSLMILYLSVKSVLNKDKNHYYYNIFLEKCLYQLDIFYSKLIKTKTNSKYLMGYLDKVKRPLVLIMPKMS